MSSEGLPSASVLVVPNVGEAPAVPESFDLSRRVSAGNLITAIATELDLPEDFATPEDVAHVNPFVIDTGLFYDTRRMKELIEAKQVTNTFRGIGFTAGQMVHINRSPVDLAESSVTKNLQINEKREPSERLDPDEAKVVADRAAIHQLETLELKQLRLTELLQVRLDTLRAFFAALSPPTDGNSGYNRYTGQNMVQHLQGSHEAIFDCLRIAYFNKVWAGEGTSFQNLAAALTQNLYGIQHGKLDLMSNWRQYTHMAGQQTRRQITAANYGRIRTRRQIETRQLDAIKALRT